MRNSAKQFSASVVLIAVIALFSIPLLGWLYRGCNPFPLTSVSVVGLIALTTLGLISFVAFNAFQARADRYAAALVATVPFVPGAAAVIAVVAYVSRLSPVAVNDLALLIGTVIALSAWLIVALLVRNFTAVHRANTRVYGQLLNRYRQLKAHPLLSCPPKTGTEYQMVVADASGCTRSSACNRAQEDLKALDIQLGVQPDENKSDIGTDLQWVLGTGYINLWNIVHRVEEALIELESRDVVISEALYDELRLKGSTIPSRDDLLIRLRYAVTQLSPGAARYLAEQPPVRPAHSPTQSGEGVGGAVPADPSTMTFRRLNDPSSEYDPDREARAVLLKVRRNLNEFRDGGRESLVRARNRLMKAVMFTGVTTYLLLGLALVVGVPPNAVVAGVAFYMVGAVIGLFNLLYTEGQSDTGVEDYGLSTARLIHRPLFSGLAAVGGVVLVAMLVRAVNTEVLEPSSANAPSAVATPAGSSEGAARATTGASPPAAGTGANSDPVPTLADIFDLNTNRFGLVVAAIFGLTPELLLSRLRQQTERYKADIRTSEAS